MDSRFYYKLSSMSSKITKKGLELLTARYLGNPWVAGMDLRNEIRPEHDLGATYDYDYNGIDDNSHLYYL